MKAWLARYRIELLLVAAVILSRVLFIGYYYDDGFIYFRYIANLFAGNGLTYNHGEYVSALTSPLWTLLLTIGHASGLALPATGVVLGIAADCVTGVLLLKLVRQFRVATWISVLAVVTFICDGFLATVTVSGLETAVYAMLIVGAWYALATQKTRWLYALAILIPLVRLDGLLVSGLIVVAIFLARRTLTALRVAGGVMLALGLSALTHFIYYHDLIPHSIVFKYAMEKYSALGTSIAKLDAMLGFSLYQRLLSRHVEVLAILVLVIVLGLSGWLLIRAWRLTPPGSERTAVRTMTLWLVGYVAFFTFSSAPRGYGWYYVAPHAVYYILLAIGLSTFNRIPLRWLCGAVCYAIILIHLFLIPFSIQKHSTMSNADSLVAAAAWMERQVPRDKTVAVGAVGMVGYYAPDVTIVDLHGLVNEEVFEFRVAHNLFFNEQVNAAQQEAIVSLAFRPDYVLTGYPDAFALASKGEYAPVMSFAHLVLYRHN